MEKEILEMNGQCPYCGKKIREYSEGQSIFGSPIRTCKKCNGTYWDRRYHEIAIEGIGNTLSIARTGKIALIFLGLFMGSFLINLWTVFSHGEYSIKMAFVQWGSLFAIVCALVDVIRIKTGLKEKSLEKKRMESVNRLRDAEYARTLKELGYDVPEEYL